MDTPDASGTVGIPPAIGTIIGCIPFCPGIIIIIGIPIGIAAIGAPAPGAVPAGIGDAPMFIDARNAKFARTCRITSSISMLDGKLACGFAIPAISGALKAAAK